MSLALPQQQLTLLFACFPYLPTRWIFSPLLVCLLSELFIGTFGCEGIHELWQAYPTVQFIPIKTSQKTLQLYLTSLLIPCGLLSELGCLIEITFEIASEFAWGQETTLKPVKLIEDSAKRHWHTFLHLLANTLNHAFSINWLTYKRFEKHAGLGLYFIVARSLTTLHIITQSSLNRKYHVCELPEAESHVFIGIVAADDKSSICTITGDTKAVKSLNKLVNT